jgi:hypothetical protein
MRFADIPFQPSTRTLRQFAVLWMAFFTGLAWYHAPGGLAVALALATLLGLVGLIRPGLIRPVFVTWMVLAFPIGWVVSRVVLAALYYGLFTPLAIVFRLAGRDALNRRTRPRGDSYWIPKPAPADVGRYYRQF